MTLPVDPDLNYNSLLFFCYFLEKLLYVLLLCCAASPFKYLKQKIDILDKENLICKYTMIEGDPLGDKLESISYEVKFEARNDGGCVCKMASSYKTIGDFDVNEEDVKEGRESTIGIYKVVEAYLLENPQVYA